MCMIRKLAQTCVLKLGDKIRQMINYIEKQCRNGKNISKNNTYGPQNCLNNTELKVMLGNIESAVI